MRKVMLQWPVMILAGLSGLIICVLPVSGAPLVTPMLSRDSGSVSDAALAREVLADHLRSLGYEDSGVSRRLEGLSDAEVQRFALSLETVLAGGETEAKKAAGVALVILLTVGAIAGFYLFYNANR